MCDQDKEKYLCGDMVDMCKQRAYVLHIKAFLGDTLLHKCSGQGKLLSTSFANKSSGCSCIWGLVMVFIS